MARQKYSVENEYRLTLSTGHQETIFAGSFQIHQSGDISFLSKTINSDDSWFPGPTLVKEEPFLCVAAGNWRQCDLVARPVYQKEPDQ